MIWELMNYLMGGYETFRFEQEIISEIYSTTHSSRMKPDSDPTNYDDAYTDLNRSLVSRDRYDYTYFEFIGAQVLRCFCCFRRQSCYKNRIKRLQRH